MNKSGESLLLVVECIITQKLLDTTYDLISAIQTGIATTNGWFQFWSTAAHSVVRTSALTL